MVTWAVSVLSNHDVSQFPRVSPRSFGLVLNICIDKCALVESQLSIIFIWRVLHLFIMFIVPAVNKIQVFLRNDSQAYAMQVFGQFELVISIFSVGLLNTKGDMQTLSSFSLNCSYHKLTHLLINLPMAVSLWLVSRIRLPGTLTDSDMLDVLLQCLRSILAVVNPLDHGLVLLYLHKIPEMRQVK